MKRKISLYVVAHKDLDETFPERTIIGVGNKKNINVASLYDNTGDNISEKNPFYCELTAMYWIWKNDHNSDIVGIEHYRRQFLFNQSLINKRQVYGLLKKYDIIVPYAANLPNSLYVDFWLGNEKQDLIKTRKIIKKFCPEFLLDFDFLKKTNRIHPCNMLITRKKIYDQYCSWLFPILFELEKHTDLSCRDDYHKRLYGFLSERLFNVWLHHYNNLKVKVLKISEPDDMENSLQHYSVENEIRYIVKYIINYRGMYR